MLKNIKYFMEYIVDKKVPLYKKGMILLSLLYFILPIDIVPDFIIGLGWLDDAVVAAFIWNALSSEMREYIADKKHKEGRIISLEEKKKTKNR
jgi:uncharacterized membrane protein YkvA (DUF1232 family)